LRNKYLSLLLCSNALIVLDQFTKYFVISHIPRHHSIWVVEHFFSITHIRNSGVAFGLFASHSSEYKALTFVLISTIAIMAILIIFHQTREQQRLVIFGLILIFSGAIGNLIDRVLHGEVIDFIYFHFGDFHFPAFNVADSCISIGVGCMVLDLFKNAPPSNPNADLQGPSD